MDKKNFFLVAGKHYYNDRIFDLETIKRNDYRGYEYYVLREELKKRNIGLNTFDKYVENRHKSYELIFLNLKEAYSEVLLDDATKYLIITEPKPLLPISWDIETHAKYFKKVITWNDEYVDDKKYFKFHHPNGKIDHASLYFDLNQVKKLCVVIAGNKFSNHKLSLYAERIKAIRWFEKNHPEDFDLYGIGWDKKFIRTKFVRRLNKYDFVTRNNFFRKAYPSYRGTVDSKLDILKKYKFSICYENVKNQPGYISEKIFDCFLAGTIPIYSGAQNITDYIPGETFISKDSFKTYEDLYAYLTGMPESEYVNYLTAIKEFIHSKHSYPFTAESYAKNIIDIIT